jgi:glycosyltransferase involved in cell wall biosynthesis
MELGRRQRKPIKKYSKMPDKIVGMMWAKNEGDILEEILTSAVSKVDSLFIADDESDDNSWAIINDFANTHRDKVEYIRNKREKSSDQGQRNSLLIEIRKRYKPENTWVQIIEGDIMLIDTDIKDAIKGYALHDVGMSWQTLNAIRKPGTWKEADTYPKWDKPIKEVMPYFHHLESMLYTFRPLPGLYYNPWMWRPWPQGFSAYIGDKPLFSTRKTDNSPLLGHFGYRGPTHFYEKFKNHKSNINGFHSKYKSWDLRSIESVGNTVSFFNGQWTGNSPHELTRNGWLQFLEGRREDSSVV